MKYGYVSDATLLSNASCQVLYGTNTYAILSAPRASGAEAMIISASKLSVSGDGDGTLNLRGIATVLSLANYLKGRYSH